MTEPGRCCLEVSNEELKNAFNIKGEYRIDSVSWNPYRRTIEVHVSGPHVPVVPDGCVPLTVGMEWYYDSFLPAHTVSDIKRGTTIDWS